MVTLMLVVFASTFAVLSIVAILVTVAFLVPTAARPWVMIGICMIFVGGLGFFLFRLKEKLNQPPALSGTLAELNKDIECLKQS